MSKPMTLVQTLQHVVVHNREIAQMVMADFSKPIEDITEQDILSTCSPKAVSELRRYAELLRYRQTSEAKRAKRWRYGGKP